FLRYNRRSKFYRRRYCRACSSNILELMTKVAAKPITKPAFGGRYLAACIADIRTPYDLLEDPSRRIIGLSSQPIDGYKAIGRLGPLWPEWLGDRRFTEVHGCRFPYVVGEMARGVATPEMVIAAAKAGFLGFYGAAGLSLETVSSGIREIERN